MIWLRTRSISLNENASEALLASLVAFWDDNFSAAVCAPLMVAVRYILRKII
jgi:hypothetical protein